MNKEQFRKEAHSFEDDLQKELKSPSFRKAFYRELLRLQIAEEIIRLRKVKKLTQKQLADKIDTTQAVISRIENGQVYPSTRIIQRICEKLEVQARFEFYDVKR